MERWEMIKGKTLEEANEELKNLGYFVTTETDNHYQNGIIVELEEGKINKIKGIGTWKANEG